MFFHGRALNKLNHIFRRSYSSLNTQNASNESFMAGLVLMTTASTATAIILGFKLNEKCRQVDEYRAAIESIVLDPKSSELTKKIFEDNARDIPIANGVANLIQV